MVDDVDALFVLDMPNRRLALPAGSRPSSVAVAPDGLTAWVALRGLGSVSRVVLATGEHVEVSVGAEPTGVALSPSGRTLVVATFGERTISLVDTQTLAFSLVDVGRNPRALTITNDGDADDDDESAFITLFFGEPLSEGTNTGRVGNVVEVNLGSRIVTHRISLVPVTGCVPNQLTAITEVNGQLFVVHTCAMPAAPNTQTSTVAAGLSVINRSTRLEVFGPTGSRTLTGGVSGALSRMANPIDVAPFDSVAVVVLSQGANELRVSNSSFSRRVGLSNFYMGGSPEFSDEPECGVPTGVLTVNSQFTLVLDATGRRVLLFFSIDPMSQPMEFPFETLPLAGSPASQERLGRRHFTTAEGPWSAENSVSCSSCHPDGLTDGLTWMFSVGPRQTPSLAGTFERGQLSKHRAQGWTATADEISDVEHLVRTLAGGSGVIFDSFGMGTVPLTTGSRVPDGARHDGLSASSRDLVLASPRRDWIEVESWIASLPRPPASKLLNPAMVSRGRQIFANGGCASCHGGSLWTVSRIPYVPSFAKNGSAVGDDGVPDQPSGLRIELRGPDQLWNPALNTDTMKIGPELLDGGVTVGPERITCVLRDVGTFDLNDPIEVKPNGQPAQGELGFNPPSLFGLKTSAPYLHHGKAKTLEELFSPQFARHHEARVPGFLSEGDGGVNADQVNDLIAFLESIDEKTLPFAIPLGNDVCGAY